MRIAYLTRRLHRWGVVVVGIPFLCVAVSGILLQVKKQVPWVQPTEQRTPVVTPQVGWDIILAAAQAMPEAGVVGWADIERVDVRPGKGILKVVTHSRWEAQLALADGAVLQVAYRRSDLIEQFHDGSWFGDAVKLGLFLPSGVVMFVLWITGLYLWFLPYWTRRKRARNQRAAGGTAVS